MFNCGWFHQWCIDVIPLIYDDSLSIYELLCKFHRQLELLRKSLEETKEQVETNEQDIAQLKTDVQNINTAINDLTTKVNKNISDIQNINSNIVDINAVLDTHNSAIGSINDSISTINTKLTNITSQLESINTEINTIKSTYLTKNNPQFTGTMTGENAELTGDASAQHFIGDLMGNADTATSASSADKLKTSYLINGWWFDGENNPNVSINHIEGSQHAPQPIADFNVTQPQDFNVGYPLNGFFTGNNTVLNTVELQQHRFPSILTQSTNLPYLFNVYANGNASTSYNGANYTKFNKPKYHLNGSVISIGSLQGKTTPQHQLGFMCGLPLIFYRFNIINGTKSTTYPVPDNVDYGSIKWSPWFCLTTTFKTPLVSGGDNYYNASDLIIPELLTPFVGYYNPTSKTFTHISIFYPEVTFDIDFDDGVTPVTFNYTVKPTDTQTTKHYIFNTGSTIVTFTINYKLNDDYSIYLNVTADNNIVPEINNATLTLIYQLPTTDFNHNDSGLYYATSIEPIPQFENEYRDSIDI